MQLTVLFCNKKINHDIVTISSLCFKITTLWFGGAMRRDIILCSYIQRKQLPLAPCAITLSSVLTMTYFRLKPARKFPSVVALGV